MTTVELRQRRQSFLSLGAIAPNPRRLHEVVEVHEGEKAPPVAPTLRR